jgi:hypothetical protein
VGENGCVVFEVFVNSCFFGKVWFEITADLER